MATRKERLQLIKEVHKKWQATEIALSDGKNPINFENFTKFQQLLNRQPLPEPTKEEMYTELSPSITQSLKKSKKLSPHKLKWKAYKKLVWDLTEKQPIHKLPNFDKRGPHNYHLDHKISVWFGYKNNIDPKIIADVS